MFEWLRRLEPLPPYGDLERGFTNEVADPMWFLSRQWQLGEHAGEDAGTPVGVQFQVAHAPIDAVAGMDPTLVPAEAILEGAALDWWTPGRRVRVGRAVAGSLSAAQRRQAAFDAPLPEPYGDAFRDQVDGMAAWRLGLVPENHPSLAGFDAGRPDFWRPGKLDHAATFPVGDTNLEVTAHGGGEVDWYSVDAAAPLTPEGAQWVNEVIPARLHYPGAPLPRVWQIEDHQVDLGGYPPDRSHLGTALLIELVSDHANDWFLAPVPPPSLTSQLTDAPSVGVVVTIVEARVRSSFDQYDQLRVPPNQDLGDPDPGPDEPIGPWSLFRTTGLSPTSLVVWPTAATPLTGPVRDDIVLGVDEDADALWAVELRADGVEQASDALASQALTDGQRTGSRKFEWIPSSALPEHWHPYRIEPTDGRLAFVQGLVGDLTHGMGGVRRGPRSELIGGVTDQEVADGVSPDGRGHLLELDAVPYQGVRLERRYLLARGTDGRPVLWRQRSRVPLLGPPVSNLRFDVLREAPQSGVPDTDDHA
jgi:hypothetical protein